MQVLGFIIGYLLAFTIYLIKQILKFPFKILNIDLFQETVEVPQFLNNKKGNVDKLESFKKGDEFEDFIRKNLFQKSNFTMVERTHTYDTNKDDYVESTLKPDFKFRSLKTGNEFYIEAKWRQSLFNNSIKWSYPKQFERYQSYSKDCTVYIVIGLGGTPNNPNNIYMENIDCIDGCLIPQKVLSNINFYSQREKYNI